jgi:hypothetical protein
MRAESFCRRRKILDKSVSGGQARMMDQKFKRRSESLLAQTEKHKRGDRVLERFLLPILKCAFRK